MPSFEERWKRFEPKKFLLMSFENWDVVLRKSQITLGSSVFLLKRPTTSMSTLTAAEASEFPLVCLWFEERVSKKFGAERYNYIASMMIEEWVHFHVFPRYSRPVKAIGSTWVDSDWPKVAQLGGNDNDDETLINLRNSIRCL